MCVVQWGLYLLLYRHMACNIIIAKLVQPLWLTSVDNSSICRDARDQPTGNTSKYWTVEVVRQKNKIARGNRKRPLDRQSLAKMDGVKNGLHF
jgi:hypothetical protein